MPFLSTVVALLLWFCNVFIWWSTRQYHVRWRVNLAWAGFVLLLNGVGGWLIFAWLMPRSGPLHILLEVYATVCVLLGVAMTGIMIVIGLLLECYLGKRIPFRYISLLPGI